MNEIIGEFYVDEIGQYVPDRYEALIKEMRREIADPSTADLYHGTQSARVTGCTGPLCKKAIRDQVRFSRLKIAVSQGRVPRHRTRPAWYLETDPIIESFQKFYDLNKEKKQTGNDSEIKISEPIQKKEEARKLVYVGSVLDSF